MVQPALYEVPLSITNEINKAIAAHGIWKQHLREAIATRQSQFRVERVQVDNDCDFGKWLQTFSFADQQSPQFKTVQALHTPFHQEAAHVLQLALTGRQAEAEQAMALGGPFAKVSANLTIAMSQWRASFMQHV